MYPNPIEFYYAPASVAEVLAILGRAPAATLLAGGQSLLPLMKARERAPNVLVDINRVAGLGDIAPTSAGLSVGALVRYREVLHTLRTTPGYAALADAIAVIGDRQVRNRGTLPGNLAHGDHTGDIRPCALVFDARLASADPDDGEALIDVAELPPGTATSVVGSNRFFTRLEFGPGVMGSAFMKFGRVAQDRAIINVAAALDLRTDGTCTNVRIAVGGVPPRAVRIGACETALEGRLIDASLLQLVGDIAADTVTVHGDGMAGAAYRTQLVRSGVRMALTTALTRAREAQQ